MAGKRGAETAKSGIHPATPPLPRLMPAHVVIHARSGTTGGRVELDTARARFNGFRPVLGYDSSNVS